MDVHYVSDPAVGPAAGGVDQSSGAGVGRIEDPNHQPVRAIDRRLGDVEAETIVATAVAADKNSLDEPSIYQRP